MLLHFRTHKYAISADIKKAFLHIILHQDDRNSMRFFWLSDSTNPNGTFDTNWFKTILCGAVSSQFILYATLRYHLLNHLSREIERNLYGDNMV